MRSLLSKQKGVAWKSQTSTKHSRFVDPSSPVPLETQFASLLHLSKTNLQLLQIHTQILLHNLSSSSFVNTQLISASSLHKFVDYSLLVFNHFHPKNLFLFNALIRGLVKNSQFKNAICYFVLMMRNDVRPDWLTYPFVLKSIAGLGLDWLGGSVHGLILKCGVEVNSFVWTSLVDMYVKVEKLMVALKMLDESPLRFDEKSVLSWNVLINGCCKAGCIDKAVELFEAMPERNTASWNCLMNGFFGSGDLDRATQLFDEMPKRDVISWTTMINGFVQKGHSEKAVSMFWTMLEEDIKPNDFTVVSVLSACAKIGALESGSRIHDYLRANGFLFNATIGTALVDMYAKCGHIEFSSQVFKATKEKDILTWSVMIWGWAIHGHFKQAIQCFKNMMYAGIKPDEVVLLAILTACAHCGQVQAGLDFFNIMKPDYCIEPTMKHHALIVDLLGKAGRLNEALLFIESMRIAPDVVVWGALFCACRAHRNVKMAELASEKLQELEPEHPGSYVFLSNVYATAGRWEDVEKIRVLMRDNGIVKDPGWSHVELEGRIHSFVAGDRAHECSEEIYLKLEETVAAARTRGYAPATEWVLHNVEEEEMGDSLATHSEKLALSFALIRSPPGTLIRIVKNLRVCGDCHCLMKCVSDMSGREVVLRDVKRFHHFKNGTCSCKDYW